MGLRNKVNKDGFISKEVPNVESKFYIDEQVHINHLAPASGNQSITVNSDGEVVADESTTFTALSSSFTLVSSSFVALSSSVGNLSSSVDSIIAPTQTVDTGDGSLTWGGVHVLTSVADGMTIPLVAAGPGSTLTVVNAMAATAAVLTRSGSDVVVNGTSATSYNLPAGETVVLRAASTGTNVYIERGGEVASPNLASIFFDDFMTFPSSPISTTNTSSPMSFASPTSPVAPSNAIGVKRALVGSAGRMNGGWMTTTADMPIGLSYTTDFETRIYIHNLSDVSEEYIFQWGLLDLFPASSVVDTWLDQNNGFTLAYNRVTSDNWILQPASEGAFTAIITSEPVAAGAWHRLRLFRAYDAATDTATLRASIAHDGEELREFAQTGLNPMLPSGTGRVAPFYRLLKTAGTAQRYIDVDYAKLTLTWPLGR